MAFCLVVSHSQALRSFWKKYSLREWFRNLKLKDVDCCGRAKRLFSASAPKVGACAGSGIHQSQCMWRSYISRPGSRGVTRVWPLLNPSIWISTAKQWKSSFGDRNHLFQLVYGISVLTVSQFHFGFENSTFSDINRADAKGISWNY